MTTQIIRDTTGVITTGRFCIFGGSKKQQISCDNASTEMKFSLAINTAKLAELSQSEMESKLTEIMTTATFTHKGVTLPLHQFGTINTVTETSELDWVYDNLPEGFTLLNSQLNSISTNTFEPQTFEFKFKNEFNGWIIFVTPEQDNKSIINKGIELSFCLAPLSNSIEFNEVN
jgi:hypothetical protein